MEGKAEGDSLRGEKIIVESGELKVYDNVPLSKAGHRGKQAIARKNAYAVIDKPLALA